MTLVNVSKPSGSKVLVTGATGGLGQGLVETLLTDGYAVRATGRNLATGKILEALGAEFIFADLTDQAQLSSLMQGIDGVFHTAGLSSPWGRYSDFYRINVQATQDLWRAAKAAGCGRFIFVSSPSVYARLKDQVGLEETSSVNHRPLGAYARTKLLAEKFILAHSDVHMPCVALRPRAITGPHDTVILPRFMRLIRQGKFPLVNQGRALLQMTDVRDVCRALILADKQANSLGGEVFNIAGAQALSIRKVASHLAEARGLKVSFAEMPYAVMIAIAACAEGVCRILPSRPEPFVTVYTLSTLAFSQTFNLKKARDILGFIPQYKAFNTLFDLAKTYDR